MTGDVYHNGPGRNVSGAVLFGDPYFNHRDRAADLGSAVGSGLDGLLGTRPLFGGRRALSYCHQHDPICQGPLSFTEIALYRFTRHSNYADLGEPEQAAQYFAPLLQ